MNVEVKTILSPIAKWPNAPDFGSGHPRFKSGWDYMSEDESDNGTVFKIKFECKNCGNVFDEEFKRGTKVKREGTRRKKYKVYCSDTVLSHNSVRCDECRIISCPVCNLKDELKELNRNPLNA